ncbi:maleylpyruvate isomerase N-terminal domain-containing protein [Tsukamurella strandjordii]|uniref:Maleylpyruvate isomerase N-terminal domain-containing protein n=1 Tax=Tsukamurella strandjordii TaxID=147577 RepID=A0AA90SMB4_9ACTN|nr:maleylpyruvate isomerase N-terminal domain-containing protein [Tsukamurella strandjordii]MDP0399142.1 maleylpyruvate isomerase N-terminal domain-containing protein [Tsukamurella strandjordii]
MTTALWFDSIAADGARIAATDPEGLGRPVPSCPGWTVRDLVIHTGAANRWATMFLQAGADSTDRFVPDVSDAPDGAAVLGWYAGVVAALLDELRRHDPDEPARAFVGRTKARFWMRRMTQEVSVHRWDLQNSLPDGAEAIAPAVAADGITELTQMQMPLILGRQGLAPDLAGRVIAIVATDTGDEWVVRLRADGVDVLGGEDALAPADLTLRGIASDLELVLWRRLPLDTVEVRGERAVIEGLLATLVI